MLQNAILPFNLISEIVQSLVKLGQLGHASTVEVLEVVVLRKSLEVTPNALAVLIRQSLVNFDLQLVIAFLRPFFVVGYANLQLIDQLNLLFQLAVSTTRGW